MVPKVVPGVRETMGRGPGEEAWTWGTCANPLCGSIAGKDYVFSNLLCLLC